MGTVQVPVEVRKEEGFLLNKSGDIDLLTVESWNAWPWKEGASAMLLGFCKDLKPFQGQYGDLLKSYMLTFPNEFTQDWNFSLLPALSPKLNSLQKVSQPGAKKGAVSMLKIMRKLTTESRNWIKDTAYNKLLRSHPLSCQAPRFTFAPTSFHCQDHQLQQWRAIWQYGTAGGPRMGLKFTEGTWLQINNKTWEKGQALGKHSS